MPELAPDATKGADARAARVSWWAAVAAIAATYGYFLIFAEFAFLELVRAVAPDRIRLLMGGLGAGGVLGAAGAAWWYRPERGRQQLAWAFRACAAAAGLALAARTVPLLLAAAGAVGLALGALTVTLAATLRGALGGARLGLGIGAGTGLAYAACNLPGIFQATPAAQTAGAAVVVALASLAPHVMRVTAGKREDAAPEFDRAGVARWVVVLLALVWMDSAAFYIIQHAPELRRETWGDAWTLAANAAVHLGAALGAGVLLDRGWRGALAGTATALLAVACLMLNGVLPAVVPAVWWYAAGVSLYSTVLVEYPARSGRPGVGALVFAVAGWIGSALGIGMGQDLATIPLVFVLGAGATVAVVLGWRGRARRRWAGAAVAVLVAGVLELPAQNADPLVTRGREVYVAEGCIHCHSQFVRPRVAADVEWWGPARSLPELLAETPPLPGNRRQGPDLANVGNRRSPEWNRLHLVAPRRVSPGSRMPSYAHLFAGGDGRGEALVAYLASLGAETLAARREQAAAWQPRAGPVTPPEESRRRFQALCAPCHGETGRGDGVLARQLSLPPPDWALTPWRHVPPGGEREEALSRIIKFGLPGLAMAGHETLPDREVVGLARYVQTLHNAPGRASLAAAQP